MICKTVQYYAYKSVVLKKKLFVIITELTNGENKTKQNKTKQGMDIDNKHSLTIHLN